MGKEKIDMGALGSANAAHKNENKPRSVGRNDSELSGDDESVSFLPSRVRVLTSLTFGVNIYHSSAAALPFS